MDRLGLAVQPILTATDSLLAVLSTGILRKYGRRGQLLPFFGLRRPSRFFDSRMGGGAFALGA